MIGQEIIDRFKALLGPKGVITDPDDVAPWLTDWRGRFHGNAVAILQPISAEEVAATITLAGELGVPLVPQGGNTSMVGGATPPPDGSALILSLRRMNRIRALSADDNLAVCEAGVILATLHDAADAAERRFPLSLGAKGSATIGGLISTNAGGTQVLRHGTMRALVEGLEAVLPDGSVFHGLDALKKDNRGYDIKQLLIGAEGTLGIITAASLRLVPAIAARAVGWVGVRSPADALALLRLAEARLGDSVEAFEIDHADLSDPGPAERLEQALAEALEDGLAMDAAIAANEAQAAAFWRIRESLSEAERAQGPALQYDISVPIARMPAFMIDAAAAAERSFPGTTASSFGHLGDGNVHFHVRAPKGTVDGPAWIAAEGQVINAFVHDAVVAAGGSISAEHGIGEMKRAELGRLASPARP
jgi:FAD/FMN-containing dehydrogenase